MGLAVDKDECEFITDSKIEALEKKLIRDKVSEGRLYARAPRKVSGNLSVLGARAR